VNDRSVQDHIEQLVEEEHRLLRARDEDVNNEERHERLEEVRVELDRYWDLLRQRRAQEEFGGDPDSARTRSAGTVENYEQ
jgi:hypothetical protein